MQPTHVIILETKKPKLHNSTMEYQPLRKNVISFGE